MEKYGSNEEEEENKSNLTEKQIEQMTGVNIETDDLSMEQFRMFFATSINRFALQLRGEYVDR